jgi:hypothetical protein
MGGAGWGMGDRVAAPPTLSPCTLTRMCRHALRLCVYNRPVPCTAANHRSRTHVHTETHIPRHTRAYTHSYTHSLSIQHPPTYRTHPHSYRMEAYLAALRAGGARVEDGVRLVADDADQGRCAPCLSVPCQRAWGLTPSRRGPAPEGSSQRGRWRPGRCWPACPCPCASRPRTHAPTHGCRCRPRSRRRCGWTIFWRCCLWLSMAPPAYGHYCPPTCRAHWRGRRGRVRGWPGATWRCWRGTCSSRPTTTM